MNIPAIQQDHKKNLAITVQGSQVVLGEYASCWLPHTSGNLPRDANYSETRTVSLELLNSDGYYLMQKDYKFVLAKYNGSGSNFGMVWIVSNRVIDKLEGLGSRQPVRENKLLDLYSLGPCSLIPDEGP